LGWLVIAVTGTPGTGKSEFSRRLAKRLRAQLVDLNQLILEKKLFHVDREGVRVAHLGKLRREFSKLVGRWRKPVVVDGLLSHLLGKRVVSHVVVLRTRPRVLERRLKRKGYRGKKLTENLEAEALDIILCEAVWAHGLEKVFELDTTQEKPSKTVAKFLQALKGKISLRPGKVSWLKEFYRL
jgi:adenylate kinase